MTTATREHGHESAAVAQDPLWERLRRVELRVRAAVGARRATDPDPDDPYRGQYLTPEAVERILAEPASLVRDAAQDAERDVSDAAPPAPGSRLAWLMTAFRLRPLDVELLLVAMAPDVDARFERLYGYLNDDLTRRRPTIGLALELCGLHAAGEGRARFSATAPLVDGGLVEIIETGRPLLSRELRVPDRVTAHLLGGDAPDDRLHGLITVVPPDDAYVPGGAAHPDRTSSDRTDPNHTDPDRTDPPASDRTARLTAAVRSGAGLVHVVGGGDAGRVAARALAAAGRRALVVDVAALVAGQPPQRLAAVLATEARLGGGGVVLGPLEALEPERPERAQLLRDLCAAGEGLVLIAYGTKPWDPLWTRQSPVPVVLPAMDGHARAEQWREAFAEAAAEAPAPATMGREHADEGARPGHEVVAAVAPFRLDADQVTRAASVAARTAAVERRPVRAGDLLAAVRAQNGAGLARLARRIEPAVGWADLVLPPSTHRQLRELALRAKHREQVLGRWRMRPGGGRGRGVIALFAGESGTGKTMSAEVVAADLGMELYVVDLSTVVDKYIGETEKNLERIFAEASSVNAVLLFDEADAIFGKRSQVKDAHDRHANIESAYLLQRMESFDGIAVLTTNLRTNLDEAFTRRLDVIAEFVMPDEKQRQALWDRCLGDVIPRGDDLDLEFCARRFELAGGSIRACAVTAAYLAAEARRPLGMAQVVSAVLQEYRKLGRLVLESEFGPWLDEGPVRPH